MNELKIDSTNRYKYLSTIFIVLIIFSILFGYIESSVAHYLRKLYYSEGFIRNLKVIDSSILNIEMGRELSTLLIIFIIILLTKGPFCRRFANYVFVFAVWDITYYLFLYIFEGWPYSLFSWDVLFLIPVPWFAPVISPIIISITGIIGSLLIHFIYAKKGFLKIKFLIILLIILSLITWQLSFILYSSYEVFPERYNWELFIFGLIFSISALYFLFIINIKKT